MADIQSQINRISQNIADSYDAAELYGATMPTIKNSNNLANTIKTISTYTHPSYTPHESGLYKITVDEIGSISAVEEVTKQDIIDLGINISYDDAEKALIITI